MTPTPMAPNLKSAIASGFVKSPLIFFVNGKKVFKLNRLIVHNTGRCRCMLSQRNAEEKKRV